MSDEVTGEFPFEPRVLATLRRLARAPAVTETDRAAFPGIETRLIVYGSLRPGGLHHDLVGELRGSWRSGWVTGELREDGWAAEVGYPVLRWDPEGARVPAHLLESADLVTHWERLDAFEGEEYRRIPAPFFLGEGGWIAGQVYVDARLEA